MRERGRELQAVAELKIDFVRAWLNERRNDALVQAGRLLVAHHLATPDASAGPYGADTMTAQLENLRKAYGYEAVLLLDRGGRMRLHAGTPNAGLRNFIADSAVQAMSEGTAVVSRAYHAEAGGRAHLDVAAPVSDTLQSGASIVGALVLHFDPRVHLDPLLQRWPAPSESGETFLVERVEGKIAYLSSLRHADAAAMQKKVNDPTLPAAHAARGMHGVTEGLDYRGVPVLAAVGKVPGMPWFVVAKLDRAEVLAPVRRQAAWSGVLSSLLVLALGLAMLAWQRRGQSELALAQQAAAKEALAASEVRFRRLHEHGWDFNILFDRGMVMRYASPSIDRLLGHQAIGREITAGTARVHPGDVARVEAARQAALKQPGKPQFVAHRLAGEDSGWLSVEACFTNFLDDPDIAALAYTARDVSDRIEAERRQLESEAQYQLLFKLSPDAVFVHRNNIIHYANDAAARLFGADTASALIGQDWHTLIVPEDWPKTELRVAFLMDGGQDILPPSEAHYRSLDGRAIPVEATGARIDLGGEAAIMSVVRDISERKQAEAKLKESEERLRAIFEFSPVGIAIADAEGRYTMVNPAQCRMLGYGEEELIGRSFSEFTHREDAQANLDLTALVRSGTAEMASLEKRYVRKDGSLFWVLLTVSRICGAEGEPIGTVGIAQDITERREAEAERLEHLRRQRDTLVREVHHRIKNHLQGLTGLLNQHKQKHPALQEALDTVIAQITAISLIHGLQSREVEGEVRLYGLLKEIVAFHAGMASLAFANDGQPECLNCAWHLADAESVPHALILNELITNAIKHRDEPSAPVRVACACNDENIVVTLGNAGTLPPGFDFAAGAGLGTGLTLLRSLLPRNGAALSFTCKDGQVETRLVLSAPVVSRQREDQVVSLR
ncbi:MAG: PAS domain S-box protein [Rhodocyclaceae bacterium]|nr:PAS domain S-box protein [Rhodocyclaceae bacterium]